MIEVCFEGKAELFAGLAIDTPNRRWKKYPVIYEDYRKLLKSFYGVLKTCDESIAFEEKGKRIVKVGVGNCMAAAGRRKRKDGEGGRKSFEYVVVVNDAS